MKKGLLLALKLLVTAGLLYWALRGTDLSQLGGRLAAADPAWLAAALAMFMLQFVVASARWGVLAARAGSTLRYPSYLRAFLIANFFNQTFVATAGGDAMRIWLTRRGGAGVKGAGFSVLSDRLFGMVVLLLFILIGLFWTLPLIGGGPGRVALLAILAAGFGGVALFLLVGTRLFDWARRWKITAFFVDLSAFVRGVLGSPRHGGGVVGLSVVIHLMTATSIWLIGRALGVPFPFEMSLLFTPIVFFIALMPVSIAGWGVREGAAITAYGYAGLSAEAALAVSVMTGLVLLGTGLICGIIWLVGGHPAPPPEMTAELSGGADTVGEGRPR